MSQPMHFSTVPVTELRRKGIIPLTDKPRHVILVVDDEEVIADTLALILSQQGFSAMVAYNAKTALHIAATIPPDLLLTDVVMPEMSGVDLGIAIRKSIPECKILLFSGQAATIDWLSRAGEPRHDLTVLAKPIHPREMLARISYALDSEDPRHEACYRDWDPHTELWA